MGGLWQAGFLLLLPISFVCEVTGSPGEGRSVWGRNHSLHPTKQSQLFTYGTFPSDFMWGVGSSSLQMEGDHSNRGQSIWDTSLREPESWLEISSSNTQQQQPTDSTPGLAQTILPALQFLGVNFYHFSLSWPRLFPEGSGTPSDDGVRYYNNMINLLISKNVMPVITLYHWDLPAAIQERHGGWPNETVIHLFHDYAKFCFHRFGDRVKYWITMHNPYLIAWHGYGTGLHAPWKKSDMRVVSLVAHNLIKAHAMVWHTYNSHFRQLQKGFLSVTLGSHWVKPANSTIEQCQESIEAVLGWFAKPIHYDGDYPESLKTKHHSILPNFTEEEKAFVKGTSDFFALSFGSNNFNVSNNANSLNLRGILSWIKVEYDNPRILIMENGWFSDGPVRTEDTVIVYMMKKFINDVLQAIKHDSVNVFGYTAWSLADAFEWHNGYKLRRGLFYVDFHNKDKQMIPKSSAFYYQQVVQENGFPQVDSASEVFGQFPCDFNWGVTESVLKAESNPSSPQFIDRQLYVWNITGDGILHAVKGVKLKTRPAQCTDFTSIRKQITMLIRMKVTHYKFALNWSLILPKGDLSVINWGVLRYYRCVVEEAYLHGIKTMVMLYYPTHNSLNLPGPLLQNGGWLNKTITQAFADYAELCFREMGDLVKQWITVNEPSKLGQLYRSSNMSYQAVHNVLIAHAMAWHTYDKKYRSIQHGYVSVALHADWAEPANPFIKSHSEAAERFLDFNIAWLAEPIFGSGDYPVHMRQYINAKRQRGLSSSFLPHFTQEEKLLVKGSADFFALNHFTSWLVRHQPLIDFDQDIKPFTDVTCLHSPGKLAVVPSGMTKLLKWIKRNYGDTPIYITANGIDDHAPENDEIRIYYLQQYSRHLLQAYREENINLRGYYAFKLTDSAVPRYGFYSSTMKAKPSVDAYSAIISRNGFLLDPSYNKCVKTSSGAQCSFCEFLEQRKALIFFCCCLFSTTVLLLTVTITRKYKKRRRKLRAEKRKQLVFVLPRRKDSFSHY
ncbi:beta-klotho [Xenopus laevis]|uniref:Beta-klotho n=2 Tax=Xenopus laevis TaxID=8355 RepID=A0A1L8HTK1_XENLA|nr:beta-klotho [Xenopus laevis]OCT99436.1 hypothetical protein XELAEV_18005216mg [Xenopus laevis]